MIQDLAKQQQNRILIDMSGITYIDSSAVGVLVASQGVVRQSGGQLRLSGLTERVEKIFKLAGVDGVLTVHSSQDDAVAAFTANT
jgi:anti-sigma B factor antagonist